MTHFLLSNVLLPLAVGGPLMVAAFWLVGRQAEREHREEREAEEQRTRQIVREEMRAGR